MRFISYRQLHIDIITLSRMVPADVVGIVGVPRSGSLIGSLLAFHLHLPLATPEEFVRTGQFSGGTRVGKKLRPPPGRVLLVDDSSQKGTAMQGALACLTQSVPRDQIVTAVLYGSKNMARGVVDLMVDLHQTRRIFEWNVFHSHMITRSLVDMDGVLCLDPVKDDDGSIYLNFLRTAAPLYRPFSVGGIVTCRLEKWRGETVTWLQGHGVRYGSLTMMQYPNIAARRAAGRHAQWKAEIYGASEAPLFIESSYKQASAIHHITSRPVLCVEKMMLFGGD